MLALAEIMTAAASWRPLEARGTSGGPEEAACVCCGGGRCACVVGRRLPVVGDATTWRGKMVMAYLDYQYQQTRNTFSKLSSRYSSHSQFLLQGENTVEVNDRIQRRDIDFIVFCVVL